MYIVALFIIFKTWKQPKCPSAEEGTKKVQYPLLSHKNERTGPFVETWMNLDTCLYRVK